MLFQELGKMKRDWIMGALIMIAIAIIVIMCPVSYIDMLIACLGYVLITSSILSILDFLSSKKVLINYIYLTGGIAVGLLGLYVLLANKEVLILLQILFGILLVVWGIADLYQAYVFARRAGSQSWLFLAVLSVVTAIFGIITLVNPWWHTPADLKLVIGIMMLFASVESIIRVILTWPFKTV